jgi:hypothetical protein
VRRLLSHAVGAALIAAVSYRILLLAMAAVIGFSAGYLARGREHAAGQTTACALQQPDSIPG